MKVIDVSYAPPPTQQQIDCLKAGGIGKAIVGTSYDYGGDPAERVAAYKKGGFIVAEYQFPGDLKPLLTDEWWLDAENPPGAQIAEVRGACNRDPRPEGIYSSRFMWAACGLDGWDIKAEFPWLKLWMADYGELPRAFHAFGGFTEADVVMVQYEPNASVCGLTVDLNVTIGEDHMPTPEYEELKQADQDIESVIVAKDTALKDAIAALAQANAASFKAIEDRLTALEAK